MASASVSGYNRTLISDHTVKVCGLRTELFEAEEMGASSAASSVGSPRLPRNSRRSRAVWRRP